MFSKPPIVFTRKMLQNVSNFVILILVQTLLCNSSTYKDALGINNYNPGDNILAVYYFSERLIRHK